MAANTALKTDIVKLTNAYYAKKSIKKTVSEDNWAKITEPCSSAEASEAAIDICAKYGVEVPSDAKKLVAEGLDAVATYIAERSDSPLLSWGIDPAKTKTLPE